MNSVWYVLLIIFLLLFFRKRKRKKMVALNYIQRKKEEKNMQELAKKFIGKDCFIKLLEGTVDGVLMEVTDNGIVLEKEGKQQVVNLDYVMKICEYPHNKKGKRATIFGE